MKIAVLAGDGIGSEITAQALRVLDVLVRDGLHAEIEHGLVGGAAVDAAGDPLPEATAVDSAGSPAAVFRRLPGVEEGAAKDVVWTPSGMLIAGCDGGRLLAWNAALDDVTLVDRLERTVDAVRLAPAGDSRLAIAAGRLIRIYSVPSSGPPAASNAKTILTLADESGVIVKLAWSPDGRRIAYGTNHGHVATIDAATGATLGTFPKHAREVMGLAWSPAGRTVISADIESVRFSDVATTMTFDELRPGWSIEDLEVVGFGAAGTGPLLVIAGSAATAVEGFDREARVGILDLHRSLEPARSQP